MDAATERKLVRQIVRQVHPDLFSAYPYERAKNSEALKVSQGGSAPRAGGRRRDVDPLYI